MSGHSHWSGIKHKKALTDAKRANLFAKLGKLITVAARTGGANPETNLRLRLAIEQARSANMPKENIEKAIKRGAGEIKNQTEIQEVIYEAFGPAGLMLIIKTLTDNRNRSVNEIKSILADHGGKLGEPGSVMWNFEKKGNQYEPKNRIVIDETTRAQYEKMLEALGEQNDTEEIFDNL